MEVWYCDGSKVEVCSSCGYSYKTYYRPPTDGEQQDDDIRKVGRKPFILSTFVVSYEKKESGVDSSINHHTMVYICPCCGMLQVPAPYLRKELGI